MTDITELAQSMKRRATSANEFGESRYVKADDVLALLEALEKAQQRIVELDRKNCELDSLTQRWAVERAENTDRIAELESRAVKLPQRHSMLLREDFSEDYHTEMAYKADEVQASLAAVGIKVEAE
ncbi:TPA: hypothetical protein ACXGA6_001239 [Klebsiella pneumoniae]|uniref:hypothetical protein n=1 Tax=Klebsiella pneumoniae TaxID=573 RepID=UPI004046025D